MLLEYQRDWSRKETYMGVMEIVKAHSGAYGKGIEYASTMVHKQPAPHPHGHKPGGGAH